MFFDSIPKILYDSKGNGEVKVVTNLLKRVAVRTKIKTNTVSQKGQKYLHIHPHGSKGSDGIRALGFKNKFVTKIFSEGMCYELIEKGNSIYFKIPEKKKKINFIVKNKEINGK